jgi:hypothetical protein
LCALSLSSNRDEPTSAFFRYISESTTDIARYDGIAPCTTTNFIFFALSGKFTIDLEGRSVELLPGQGFVVPRGVMHCTQSPERSVILTSRRRRLRQRATNRSRSA